MDTDDAKCEKMAHYNLEIFEFNTFALHTPTKSATQH